MVKKMTDGTAITTTIDVCGQICPSSLLTALREVNKNKRQLRNRELQLAILTDNPDSTNRIHEAIDNMGYQVRVNDQADHYIITISK